MNSPISVTTLNNQIKSLLESTFLHVYIEGEVSRITYHNSGHLYFTLKDENSSVNCVMFRGNCKNMKFRLEEGMSVIINASISLYVPRGSYQLNCVSIEPSGSGALAKAYEQLKLKLKEKGYFDNKKSIKRYIKSIGIVTSATSAALQDMLRVASKRWPLVDIKIIDTIVQGENSAKDIAQGIKFADTLSVDVIVVGRGGGSVEDLWGFNEEIVANAIYEAKTPIVSAVGHEIDFVISDFVADLRAPTPSAAFEMILPDKNEMLLSIDEKIESFDRAFKHLLNLKQNYLFQLYSEFKKHSFEEKFYLYLKEIEMLRRNFNTKIETLLMEKLLKSKQINQRLDFSYEELLSKKESTLLGLKDALNAKNPTLGLNDYFAQTIKNGKKIRLKELKEDDIFELQSKDTLLKAKAIEFG